MSEDRFNGMTSAEADLRAHLAELSWLEMRQQVKDLAKKHSLLRGDLLALWREEHKSPATRAGSFSPGASSR